MARRKVAAKHSFLAYIFIGILQSALCPCCSGFLPSHLHDPVATSIGQLPTITGTTKGTYLSPPTSSTCASTRTASIILCAQQQQPSSSPDSPTPQLLTTIAAGTAALIVLYSEYTLKMTGCGLPAGPGGVVGALEGLSYLTVVGVAGSSIWTRDINNEGIQDDRRGWSFFMVAETLSWFAIAVGLVVLGYQVMDYGYIPNAVPMEGGMCQ